jgi:uncharacterized protein YhjY with autotransporter beta-barrel domain
MLQQHSHKLQTVPAMEHARLQAASFSLQTAAAAWILMNTQHTITLLGEQCRQRMKSAGPPLSSGMRSKTYITAKGTAPTDAAEAPSLSAPPASASVA